MSFVRYFLLLAPLVASTLPPTWAAAAAPMTALAIAPSGDRLVLGSQDGIEVRSWPELKRLGHVPTQLRHVHDLAFSPDGRRLLAAGGAPAERGEIEVLDWPSGQRLRRLTDHDDLVYRVAWSPDGKYWATAAADATCQIFDATTGQQLVRYAGHSRAVLAVCYLPDGKTVASAGVDHTVQLWDSATGKQIRSLTNHVAAVNDLAVRPGRLTDQPPVMVSIGEDRTVRLWQPTIGRLMRFARLPSPPRAVAWSPNGDRLLVGANDGRLRVLDPDTMEVVKDVAGVAGRIHALAVAATAGQAVLGGEGEPIIVRW